MGGKKPKPKPDADLFFPDATWKDKSRVVCFFFYLLNFIFLIYALQCPGNNQHCDGAAAHRKSAA